MNVAAGIRFAELADPGQAGCPGDADGSAGGGPHDGTDTIEYDISSSTHPSLTSVPAVQPVANVCGSPYTQSG